MSADEWDDTIEHCGNVMMEESRVGTRITKHYAVWADAGINTVSFSRPYTEDLNDSPVPKGISLYRVNEFKMPEGQ